jgi:hypothetical protein
MSVKTCSAPNKAKTYSQALSTILAFTVAIALIALEGLLAVFLLKLSDLLWCFEVLSYVGIYQSYFRILLLWLFLL